MSITNIFITENSTRYLTPSHECIIKCTCKSLYLYCVVLIVDDSDDTAGIRFAPASGRRQVPRVGYRRLSADWRFPSLGRHSRAVPHTVLLTVACLLDRNKMSLNVILLSRFGLSFNSAQRLMAILLLDGVL